MLSSASTTTLSPPTITLATWSNVSSITSTSTAMSQVVVDSLHMAVNTTYTCARLALHPFVCGTDETFVSPVTCVPLATMRIDISPSTNVPPALLQRVCSRNKTDSIGSSNQSATVDTQNAGDKVYVARNDSVHDVSLYDGPFPVTTTAQC